MNDQFKIITGSSISITALTNNNFVVVWDDYYNPYVQIITDNGTKVGSPLNITGGRTCNIKSLANGNYLMTYNGYNDVNFYGIIFYGNYTRLKPRFIVGYSVASIGSISNSNFMIVWQTRGLDIIGGTDFGIYGQSFTSTGEKIGNQFRVNTHIIGDQTNPSITSFANDNYIVTWQSNNQNGSGLGIYGQILDSIGNKLGSEFKINSYSNSYQSRPSAASLINNNFVVVWESNLQDTNGWGVFGNIYQSDGSVVGFNTCPFNCQSCINSTNCISCNPNFKLKSNGLCECFDGFYLDNITISTCISKFIN